MNLRKFTARTIAIASCAAMLSTNVFAATRTITPSADDGKLKVTLGGEDAGQVTFLAVDAGTALASVSGDKIQYIEQDTKTAGGNLIYTFGQRTGGADKVDLYSGGDSVESYASKTGVAVKATAVAKIKEIYETPFAYEAATADDFATKTEAQLKAILNCKMGVDYTAIGATEAEYIDMDTSENAGDFVLGTPTTTDNEIYTVTVKYKGIDAGSITVKEKDPKKLESIAIAASPTGKVYYYNDSAAEFTGDKAKELLKDSVTVTATYDDESTDGIEGKDLQFGVDPLAADADSAEVMVIYGGKTASTKITVTLTKKAITGATTVGTLDTFEFNVKSSDSVNEAFVVEKVKAGKIEDFVEYTWNDGGKSYEKLADLNVSATFDEADSDGRTFNVYVQSSKGVVWSATFKAHYTEKNAFGIKGKVTVADTWGVEGSAKTFKNGIPVGAVVTAIPVTTTNNSFSGNVAGTDMGYTAKAAIVDASGNYELELEPGDYNVYVSHTRYVVKRINASRTTVEIYRTVLDGNAAQKITVSDSDAELLTNDVTLRYAYAGDMNLDGTLNNTDFGTFKNNFGKSVPAISE